MGKNSYSIGVYVRESRDDNEENIETIEVQRDLLIDFVNKKGFGKIYSIYMDDNVSGSGFDRKGLEKLKQDIVSDFIDMIVLKDLSRLGRNNAKTLMFLDFLEEYGVRVITYDGRYDSLKDNDTVGIDSWFNERYVRDISRKIRASLRFKIERGEYIGNAPYGYIKSSTHKNRLCIEHSEAKVVREIYELYLRGYGYSYISKILNEKGYKTPSSIGMWNPVAVKRILCNAVYTGDTIQGVSEKISFKSKKTKRISSDKWIVTKDTHDAIIRKEEFEDVQQLRRSKGAGSCTHKGEIHLFKDVLYCGRCNSKMFVRTRKNRPLGYICSTYVKKGGSACTSHHINEGFLKSIVCNEIIGIIQEQATREEVIKLLEAEASNEGGREAELAHLEQLLITKQRQQDALYMDKLEGRISEQLFARMNSNMENRIRQLRDEIEKLKKCTREKIDWNEIIEGFVKRIGEDGLSNEMIKMIIKRITVFNESECYDPTQFCDSDTTEGKVVIDFAFSKKIAKI